MGIDIQSVLAILSLLGSYSLLALVIYLYIKEDRKLPVSLAEEATPIQEDTAPSGTLISLIMNWILKIALIPLILFAIISIIPTIMMSDSGPQAFLFLTIYLVLGACLSLPVSVFLISMIAERFRKNHKVGLSIVIQLFALWWLLCLFYFLPHLSFSDHILKAGLQLP